LGYNQNLRIVSDLGVTKQFGPGIARCSPYFESTFQPTIIAER